jgi:DHA1 family multidrug resistance protein-like MFS transporter
MGLVRSPEALLILRICQGFLTGTVTATLALAVTSVPHRHTGITIGIMNAATFSGTAIGPIIGGIFADLFSIKASFFIASAIMLIPVIIIIFLTEENTTVEKIKTHNPLLRHLKSTLAEYQVTLPILSVCLIGFLRFLNRPLYPLIVRQIALPYWGVSTQTGIVETSSGIAAVLSGLIVGRLADRYRYVNFGIIGACLAAVFLVPQGFVGFFWYLVLFRLLNAFFEGSLEPFVNMTIARKVPKNRQGTVLGIAGSMKSIGWSLGAIGGGYISAFWGFKAVFVFGGVLFLCMAIIMKYGIKQS